MSGLLWVRAVPVIDPGATKRAASLYEKMVRAFNLRARGLSSRRVIDVLCGIRSVPAGLPNARALQVKLDGIRRQELLRQRLFSARGQVARLAPLRSIRSAELPDQDALRGLFNRLLAVLRLRKRLVESLGAVEAARGELHRETSELDRLRVEVGKYETCPLCGTTSRVGDCS